MLKHICGQCDKTFTAEGDYLNHTCTSTGQTPEKPGPELRPQKVALSEKDILAAVRAARLTKKHG